MSLAHEGIGGGRVTNMKNSSYFTTYITEGGGVLRRSGVWEESSEGGACGPSRWMFGGQVNK